MKLLVNKTTNHIVTVESPVNRAGVLTGGEGKLLATKPPTQTRPNGSVYCLSFSSGDTGHYSPVAWGLHWVTVEDWLKTQNDAGVPDAVSAELLSAALTRIAAHPYGVEA